jgi:hypothetical protein
MWVLRAYSGSVTQSGQHWSGFGNGQLQTGVNANGAGVSVQYITTCATALVSSPMSSQTGPAHGSPTSSNPSSSTTLPMTDLSHPFDTSVTHKSLAPISLALLFPTVILYRLSLPPTSGPPFQLSFALRWASVLTFIVAYGAGLTGLVSSFTSITASTSGTFTTSSSKVLKTTHGQAGLALFIALYVLLPLLFAAYLIRSRVFASPREIVGKIRAERSRADSSDTAEKLNSYRTAPDSIQQGTVRTPPPASAGYTPSRKNFGLWPRPRDGRTSSESASESESPPPRTFEVVNRPARTRHPSAGGTPSFYEHAYRSSNTPRNLSDLSWLERRRSVNAVVRRKTNGHCCLAELETTRRVIWTMP